MTTEISKELMCIVLRENIEIWIEKEKAENLISALEQKKEKGFISIEGQFINVADVVGIFKASVMDDTIRRRNGQWKDKKGNWQDKGTRSCPKCGNILPWGKTCGYCS